MVFSKRIVLLTLVSVAVLGSACGGSLGSASGDGSSSAGMANGVALPSVSGNNVLPITVNGTLCAANSYSNKPCVSVTICSPGQANCQTISDILLDTGSYGLRVFKSALDPALAGALAPVTSGTKQVAECVQFGDGSSDWGQVEMASVVLGGEPAVSVPIQVIDSTFGSLPSGCSNADQGPADAGFNGILGVGLFGEDCGDTCATASDNGMYYGCTGSTCAGQAVAGANQVSNPVALLPQDNNGVVVALPAVPLGGVPYVDGYLMLGIGTQSNNIPSGAKAYLADPSSGEFTTSYNGKPYQSFLDTGSNAYYFTAASGISTCGTYDGEDLSEWYCPQSTENLSATNIAYGSTSGVAVSFQLGSFLSLATSSNSVFVELGGTGDGSEFDWGLPFYFGRNVYVGFEGMAASGLGIGPYWAY